MAGVQPRYRASRSGPDSVHHFLPGAINLRLSSIRNSGKISPNIFPRRSDISTGRSGSSLANACPRWQLPWQDNFLCSDHAETMSAFPAESLSPPALPIKVGCMGEGDAGRPRPRCLCTSALCPPIRRRASISRFGSSASPSGRVGGFRILELNNT
ncbi:hypothetical protein N658DRAFT_40850 [Parathielavia hyrcaniae]|uniref:Uncharacterized protein n=1 Tax=Parathielavia hyrcaniae TaxID=113614 RepID=A0AAN6T2H9_9PEZI|nr:hypothetical protein N658DRAFT_40850 [Parathielavia hyrcaniae]